MFKMSQRFIWAPRKTGKFELYGTSWRSIFLWEKKFSKLEQKIPKELHHQLSVYCEECVEEADTHMQSRQSGGCLRRFPCLK